MRISRIAVLKGIVWTSGTFGVGQLFRLAASVIVARLLAPELLGIMVIVNSLRTGVDLLSDMGIGQSIVHNKDAEKPGFYHSAWTLQAIRGALLWLVCCAASIPLAYFFNAQILAFVLPIAGLYFVLEGFSSVSTYVLQRRLAFAKLNIFFLFLEVVAAVGHVILVYLVPSIWGLVFGGLISSATKMISTHFLLSDVTSQLVLVRRFTLEILSFGKWIFLSSMIYFISMNFDRLYLGKDAPLDVLGVYGIARSISDMITGLVSRLCTVVLFPVVAAASANTERNVLKGKFRLARSKFLLTAALGVSAFAAFADVPIKILYDGRYHAAAWMLPIMAIGVWFSIISNVNETTLLGLGKPLYGAVSNAAKMLYLIVGLPIGYSQMGIAGVVLVMSGSDALRYPAILAGQLKERLAYWLEDLLLTGVMFASLGAWMWIRWASGFGTAFNF